MSRWTKADMPELTGQVAVVTGANSGIGYETALALAEHGAHVVMACRNVGKGCDARDKIARQVYGASLDVVALDLSSLESVRAFAAEVNAAHPTLNLLINNAGVMAIPRQLTKDGFEMQFGVNHMAHFALTGLLLDALLAVPQARVVTVSSLMHDGGTFNFDDLDMERGYEPYASYRRSKLANLLFAYELQRRLTASGASALSVACHPGFSATNLFSAGAKSLSTALMAIPTMIGSLLFGQSAAGGALPTLYAATAPDVQGGDYIGPTGPMEFRGAPGQVQSNSRSHDPLLAQRLWDVSAELTGVTYSQLASVPA
jgi:NAD(P)-dependent dehydrogenase (short-subunit alcohol dehydrogenase family)